MRRAGSVRIEPKVQADLSPIFQGQPRTMTKVFGLCPRCKARIKINNVERLDGRKIVCRDCGYTIRVHDPSQPASRRKADEVEILDAEDEGFLLDESSVIDDVPSADDEFALDETEAYRPPARRAKLPKKAARPAEDEEAPDSPLEKRRSKSPPRKSKQSPLLIALICGGVLLVAGGAVGGFIYLRQSGLGAAAKFEPPQKYVAIKMGIVPMSGMKPEGWESTAGGGVSGVPIYVRISDGDSISIDIRESEGSSAKGKMKKAIASGQEVHQIGGPSIGRVGDAPAVASTHEYHRGVVMKNFSSYKEGPGRAIETAGFGEGRISDFTGKESIFSSTVKGCRASVVHREHQYSIVCKCSPAQFKDVEPVFEKIIASLGPDRE
jgi:hypothetical protein